MRQKLIWPAAILSLFMFTSPVLAADAWVGNVTINQVTSFDSGIVMFAISGNNSGICNYWGSHFRLDANTDGGKQMYSMLLTAKAANRPINISYAASSTPNTTDANGCTQTTMARPWALTIP